MASTSKTSDFHSVSNSLRPIRGKLSPTAIRWDPKIKGQVTSVPDFGVFVRIEEGVEGLIHVSQLSTERVDKPSSLFKVGDEVEAEVVSIDPADRKIGLSVRALRRTEERQEMESYLKREKEGGRFSFESLLGDELRLDRDEDNPERAQGQRVTQLITNR